MGYILLSWGDLLTRGSSRLVFVEGNSLVELFNVLWPHQEKGMIEDIVMKTKRRMVHWNICQ